MRTPLTPSMSVHVLRADLQVEVLGDSAAVVDLQTNELFRLNGVAAFITQRLARPCTPETLVDAVVQSFEVDADTAREDVAAFLEELRELGWITVDP